MEAIVISRAGSPDLDDAWAIVTEYYNAVAVVVREDRRAFENYFSDGSGIWLARSRTVASPLCGDFPGSLDDVVGCIALRPLEVSPFAGEVKRLYVKPTARGQGIAGLLLDALHEFARAAGYEWLYLDTKDDLADAIRFYGKNGYSRCARYNDNPQATIFMRKRLTRGPATPPSPRPPATFRRGTF